MKVKDVIYNNLKRLLTENPELFIRFVGYCRGQRDLDSTAAERLVTYGLMSPDYKSASQIVIDYVQSNIVGEDLEMELKA